MCLYFCTCRIPFWGLNCWTWWFALQLRFSLNPTPWRGCLQQKAAIAISSHIIQKVLFPSLLQSHAQCNWSQNLETNRHSTFWQAVESSVRTWRFLVQEWNPKCAPMLSRGRQQRKNQRCKKKKKKNGENLMKQCNTTKVIITQSQTCSLAER